jgi:hypothetical protein
MLIFEVRTYNQKFYQKKNFRKRRFFQTVHSLHLL